MMIIISLPVVERTLAVPMSLYGLGYSPQLVTIGGISTGSCYFTLALTCNFLKSVQSGNNESKGGRAIPSLFGLSILPAPTQSN